MDWSKGLDPNGWDCLCGKHHSAHPLQYLKIEAGAVRYLPEALKKICVFHPLVVMDNNTASAAGNDVLSLLQSAGISFTSVCMKGNPSILPNEEYLACLEKRMDENVDFILGVGSGVINDLCKMLAFSNGLMSGIVATAPSMDGYASNSSAMELGGIKTTVYNACPAIVLCDTDILKNAPIELLRAGFGDMMAKVIAIADWRIAHLVTGEYYCEKIAEAMESTGNIVLENTEGILLRDEAAIRKMTECLVLSGIAMTCAGVSRPASGLEHTISHLLEMFALAQGRHPHLHGIQVGCGVRAALLLYQMAFRFSPSQEICQSAANTFDEEAWEASMRRIFGIQAEPLIQSAKKDGRNDHRHRLERANRALQVWPEISSIIHGVIKQGPRVIQALDQMGIPQLTEIQCLGYSKADLCNAVLFSKDLRSRYIFSSLCDDIGIAIDDYLVQTIS